MTSQAKKVGEFVELELGEDVSASPRYNHDIAPTQIRERTWSKLNIAALWVGMAVCVPTYTLGGVLTSYFGLDVIEALITILVANTIVLIPLPSMPFPAPSTASLSRCPALLIRYCRLQYSLPDSGVGGLWLVWHSNHVRGLAIHLLLSAISDSWASLGKPVR